MVKKRRAGKGRRGKSKVERLREREDFRKVTRNLGRTGSGRQAKYFNLRTGNAVTASVVQRAVAKEEKRLNHEKQVMFWVKGISREIDRRPELARQVVRHYIKTEQVKGYVIRGNKVIAKGPRGKRGKALGEKATRTLVKDILKRVRERDVKRMVEQTYKDSKYVKGKPRKVPRLPKLAARDMALFDKWLIVNAQKFLGLQLSLGFADYWREIGT